MKKTLSVILIVTMVVSALFAQGGAETQNTSSEAFPSSPITLVCPWAAGAGADLICRMFESLGNEYFGVPIVVENQVGAAGVTATINFISNAKDDGYSVIFNNGGVFTAKSLTGSSGYSIDDFRPICGIVKDVNVLVVNNKTTGITTFEELLAKYSGTGKSLTMGCATAGIPHVCMARLFKETNITTKQVAYNGAAEISAALLGGHVDVICLGASEISIVKDAKDASILCVFADETPDLDSLKGVPTSKSFGYDIDTAVWRMLLAPKTISDERWEVLYKGFTGMIQDARFVEFAKNNALTIDMKTPEGVTEGVKNELGDMIPVFQELGLGIYAAK